MKDLGLFAAGIALYSLIVFGVVVAGEESSDGSNTPNAVTTGPALPQGVQVEVNRNPAP